MKKKRSIELTMLGWVFIISNGIMLPYLIVGLFNPLFAFRIGDFLFFTSIFNMMSPIMSDILSFVYNRLQDFLIIGTLSVMGIFCGIGILNLNKPARIFTIVFNLIFVVFSLAILLPMFIRRGYPYLPDLRSSVYFISLVVHIYYILYLSSSEVKEQFK